MIRMICPYAFMTSDPGIGQLSCPGDPQSRDRRTLFHSGMSVATFTTFRLVEHVDTFEVDF